MACAPASARPDMVIGAAVGRGVAAVLVSRPFDLEDPYCAHFEVHMLPPYAERFILAQPKSQCDGVRAEFYIRAGQGRMLSLSSRNGIRLPISSMPWAARGDDG